MLLAFDIQEARRDGNRQRRADQEDAFEDNRKAVDADHSVEAGQRQAVTISAPQQNQRGKGQRDSDQREIRGHLAELVRQDHFHHQRDAGDHAQD